MAEFDVIFGMDWLSQHEATIDCKQRTVKLKFPNYESFVFYVATRLNLPYVITACKVQHFMSKGCEGFLASISVNLEMPRPTLDGVEVVRSFPEVFPNDITGLPPVREVEFGIEIILRTTPMSKAPYRLAPT